MNKLRRKRQSLPSDPIELTIDRLSHEGRGVGHIEGKIAFVDGALPGETVKAEFISRRGKYDELKVQEILLASPDRVTPPCEWAAVCGGCLLQHLSPAAQLSQKHQVLLDHLKHSAGLSNFIQLTPMTAPTEHYRRKARLAARYVHKKADVLVGFREKNSSFIADMQSCAVLVQPVSDLIRPMRDLLASMEGCRDIPQIELAVGETACVADEQLQDVLRVTLTLRHLSALSDDDLQKLRDFADQYHIEWFLQPAGPESVHKLWPLDNDESLKYFLPDETGDIEMWFRPGDFTQVNAQINRSMIRQALHLLDLQPDDKVLDLFCGLGNFTLPMARRVKSVTGVEGSAEMLERATANAQRNHINNADFYVADLFTEFDTQTWAQGGYNKLLLDPPRSGAIEIVSRMHELSPETIVYVSCNPATLARDAAELLRQGYQLTHAGVMDMFPHTGHIESMARFVRTAQSAPARQRQAD